MSGAMIIGLSNSARPGRRTSCMRGMIAAALVLTAVPVHGAPTDSKPYDDRLFRLSEILGAVHYIWLAKGFQIEPLVYLGLILGLLAARIRWARFFADRTVRA